MITIDQIVDVYFSLADSIRFHRTANWHQYRKEHLVEYCSFLSSMAFFSQYNAPGEVLEIGTECGLGTASLVHGLNCGDGLPNHSVISLDTRKECTAHSYRFVSSLGYTNFKCLLAPLSSDLVKNFIDLKTRFSLVYIDGGHSYHQCLSDLINSESLLTDKGIILCHDFEDIGCKATDEENGVRKAIYEFAGDNWQVIRVDGFGILSRKG